MKIELSPIFSWQKKLDANIHTLHKVNYPKIFSELKLALIVELAELANEIRSFKFWSMKKPSAKNIILEEYVDGIHFITSLCIYFKVASIWNLQYKKNNLTKKQITLSLLNLIQSATNIKNKNDVKKWYLSYLKFGFNLGFKLKEIIQAYLNKNKINFERQKHNY